MANRKEAQRGQRQYDWHDGAGRLGCGSKRNLNAKITGTVKKDAVMDLGMLPNG